MHSITLVLIAGAAWLSASAAFAADLSVRRQPPPPPPPPPPPLAVFNWTGCYAGGFIGGAWANDVTATDLNARNNGISWSYELDGSFIGGGTIGCNYQWSSFFVVGIEGEVGYINLEGSAADPTSLALDTVSSTSIGNWYGMITGRFGFAFNSAALIYVKAGAAFVDVSHDVVDRCNTGACGGSLIAASFSDSVTTWTVGGGIEWAFSPNWSVKAEYMFIALDEVNRSCGFDNGTTFCFDHDVGGIHTAKVGINYRFGWGAAPAQYRAGY
jgi:outer membrane immunogenic protein